MRAQGDRTMEGAALSSLSTLALWQGDETRALALARQALDIAWRRRRATGRWMPGSALGDAELALGRPAAARQAYSQARARALEIGSPWQHDASAGLARVALAAGDTAAALAALQPLLAPCGGRWHAGWHRISAPHRADLPPGPGPRRRPSRGRRGWRAPRAR